MVDGIQISKQLWKTASIIFHITIRIGVELSYCVKFKIRFNNYYLAIRKIIKVNVLDE